ncbi:hypothetical protein AGMMS49975_10090 [Clostridia bacterium]|nr:hypothetical protein AGMMS49975_10090 [Clostridia bacterium]
MKQRLIVGGVLVVLAGLCAGVSFPKYQGYEAAKQEVAENAAEIGRLTADVRQLNKQFDDVRGENALRNLREVVGYISECDFASVTMIQAFNVSGDGVDVVKNITSVTDDTICDGYAISIESSDMVRFLQYLDAGNLSYHSADFMFGAKQAVLRIRTGGGIDG